MNCWEIKNCVNADCPVYGREQVICWLETQSCNQGQDGNSRSMESCLECSVLENSKNIDPKMLMKKTISFLNRQSELREQETQRLNSDLAECFSEICDMLYKLGNGDPAARVNVRSDNALLRKLGEMLNRLAESMQDMVTDSHEMAIGLCEHYDTLNKISAGYFDARAAEDSPNELVAKLGALINKEALTLVGTIESLRTTKDQLKGAYQHFQDIIDFLPDGTFVIDREGRIIAWNRAIEQITGAKKEEMVGAGNYAYAVPFYGEARPVLIDYVNLEYSQLQHNYNYINKNGARLDAETCIPSFRGGEDKYFWATASPLFDRNGNQTGAIESIRDITIQRKSEEDKDRLEVQLRQSQKMEAIGCLAGGIAHDFNNLLTAIIGYTSLLSLAVDGNPKLLHYLDQIDTVVKKAAKLTKDILTFSRKQIMNPRPVDLLTLLRGMEDMLQRLIGEDIHFGIEYRDEPLMVQVDSSQFQQVILNLLTNARDAMPLGGTLTISTDLVMLSADSIGSKQIAPGPYAMVAVSDTGAGMDDSTKERIFEPFYTTKEVGKGTGLGLSIAFGIISQHHGIIKVDSELGAGTTFRIYLPINSAVAPTQPDKDHHHVPDTRGGTETVLLAEDNPEAREVLKATLEGGGYKVIEAADGEEAVRKFNDYKEEIRLVILDVIMPLKNGKETFVEIQRIKPGVKSIFTSGYTADIMHTKGQEAEDGHFVSKPATPRELLSKVREVLDRQQA